MKQTRIEHDYAPLWESHPKLRRCDLFAEIGSAITFVLTLAAIMLALYMCFG